MKPYFYIIQHKKTGKYYVGSKTAKNANSNTFMIEYTTSSKEVNHIIESNQEIMFSIVRLREFDTPEAAYDYETRFLRKVKAKTNAKFFNNHNNYLSGNLSEWHKEWLKQQNAENTFQVEWVKEKIKATHKRKRNVEYPMSCEKVKEVRRKNTLEKYGVENTTQLEDVKEKIQITNMERYGHKVARMNVEVNDKIATTNQIRYGGKSPAACPKVIEKMRQTNLKKYGVENYSESKEFKNKQRKLNTNKRNRKIVQDILDSTTKIQRKELKLTKGWYQWNDTRLEEIFLKIEQL